MKLKRKHPESAQPVHRSTESAPRTRRAVRAVGRLLMGQLSKLRSGSPRIDRHAQTEFHPAYEQEDPLQYQRPRTRTLRSEAVNVGERPPLLTPEQVNQQLGFEGSASLQAVIDLPTHAPWLPQVRRPQRLFVFYEAPSTGRHAERTPVYSVLTAAQVNQLHQHARTGAPGLQEIHRHSLRLSAAPDAAGRSQRERIIGRDHWLPTNGAAYHSLPPAERSAYDMISHTQTLLSLNPEGDLIIRDLESKNGTQVIMGATAAELQNSARAADPGVHQTEAAPVPGYAQAVDPWQHTSQTVHYAAMPADNISYQSSVGADPWAAASQPAPHHPVGAGHR